MVEVGDRCFVEFSRSFSEDCPIQVDNLILFQWIAEKKHQVVYVVFYEEFLVGEFQSITTQSLYSRIFSKSVWNTYSSY